MIGAAVIPVAEVLRNPLEKARDADALAAEMVEIVSRQLLGLLEPVLQKRRNP
jgi:hypothetical protein